MNKSFIYLVEWSDSFLGYDSFIVAANSESDARNTFPNGDNNDWNEKSNYNHYWIPKVFVDRLQVECIGEYKDYVDQPVVIMTRMTGSLI